MSNTAATYTLVKKAIARGFDPKEIPECALCLNIGTKDFQITIINKRTKGCLLLLDYRLENIKTVKGRLDAVEAILGNSKILSSGLWGNVKVSFKTHKFSLMPHSHFVPEKSSDYLALNCEINPKIDEIYYYGHDAAGTIVNVFAGDKLIVNYLRKIYANKKIQVLHQGSALIAGSIKHSGHYGGKAMFVHFDRGLLHIIVCEEKNLLYYNQFVTAKSEEVIKYIILVFKELKMSPKTAPLIIWGLLKADAGVVNIVKKYIKNLSLGPKPNFLKFSDEFDQVDGHRYFDTYNIVLCK